MIYYHSGHWSDHLKIKTSILYCTPYYLLASSNNSLSITEVLDILFFIDGSLEMLFYALNTLSLVVNNKDSVLQIRFIRTWLKLGMLPQSFEIISWRGAWRGAFGVLFWVFSCFTYNLPVQGWVLAWTTKRSRYFWYWQTITGCVCVLGYFFNLR